LFTGFLIYWSHVAICYFNYLHIALQHLLKMMHSRQAYISCQVYKNSFL
jgi:hypothetical protein